MRRCCLALLLLTLPALLRADEAKEVPILVLDTGGHSDEIMSVFFSADGKRLTSVAKDKTVRLWDTSGGDCVGVLRLPVGPADESGIEAGITAGYAPKKNLLAVSSPGLKRNQFWVYVIDLSTKKIVQVCDGITRPVWAVALSPDGERVAAGGMNGQLHVWDVKTGKVVSEAPGYTGLVRALAFSPDGKTLASGSWDKTARLWDVDSGKELKTLEGATEWVVGVAWSPDGKYLAASDRNHQVRLWQTDGTLGRILEGNHNGNGIAFASNPRELVVGAALVDAETGKVLTRLKNPPGGYPVVVALAPDGTQACCASGPEMVLWNTAKKRGVKEAEYRLEGKGHPLARLASISGEGLPAGGEGNGIAWAERRDAPWHAFDLAGLKLLPAPDEKTLVQAPHALGKLSLEHDPKKPHEVTVKGGDTEVTLRLPGGVNNVRAFMFLGPERVVVGSNTGLYLFDPKTGKQLRRFQGAGNVHALAPLTVGERQYFVSTGDDQVMHVWRADRNAPLLSLFVVGNDWIAWTPQGYYAASPAGERLMGWQVNNGPKEVATFHPAADFRKSLYRPDAVARLLKEGGIAEALKATGKKVEDFQVEAVLPPTVHITRVVPASQKNDKKEEPQGSLPAQVSVKEAQVVVAATAASSGKYPVTALQLLLDGRPYEGQRGVREVGAPKVGTVEKEWAVTLTPGEHKLTVLAQSAVSKATSETVLVTYTAPPAANDFDPKLHVLSIGIDAYAGDWKLECAVNDARGIVKAFETQSKDLFGRGMRSKLLLGEKRGDKDVTRDGILKGLDWLKEDVKPQDVAVVFYAGHGHTDSSSGKFYMLAIDLDPDNLDKTSVTGDDLKKALMDLPCRVVLMMDACHSAGVGPLRIKRAHAPLDGLQRSFADEEVGVVVWVAAQGPETSREDSKLKHGYFTLAVMEGLAGKAGTNKKGEVHLSALDQYVFDRVTEMSKDLQHPSMGRPPFIYSFALSRPQGPASGEPSARGTP
jgi:WD40 repeat protein